MGWEATSSTGKEQAAETRPPCSAKQARPLMPPDIAHYFAQRRTICHLSPRTPGLLAQLLELGPSRLRTQRLIARKGEFCPFLPGQRLILDFLEPSLSTLCALPAQRLPCPPMPMALRHLQSRIQADCASTTTSTWHWARHGAACG